MPRVLLLIPTTSYKATDFLAASEKLNIDVIVGSNHRQTLESVAPGYSLPLSFDNLQEALPQALAFIKRYPIDAVVSTDDDAVVLAAQIAQSLGLSHNPPEATWATRNKYQLKKKLTDAGVQTACYECFSITDSPKEIAARLDFPVVLKPIHLSASRGVIRANTPEEFKTAFERIVTILKEPDSRSHDESDQKILVESFIPGVEVALEGLLDNGTLTTLALFDKPDPLDGPFFEETLYVTPSRLSEATQQAIAQTAQQACDAIGLKEGPVHAELRVNEQGPFLIEVAARSIGGLCSRTLTFGLGISLEELILQQAMKRPFPALQRKEKGSGVMMIPIPAAGSVQKAGVLMDIQGIDEAKKIAGIHQVVITIRRKQKVIPLPEGRQYLGFIFARGETPEQVEQALRQAHQALRFTIASYT